jgi:hypothetical protein
MIINNLGQTDRIKQGYYIYPLPKPTALVGENEICVIGEEEDIGPIKKRLERNLFIDLEDIYIRQIMC